MSDHATCCQVNIYLPHVWDLEKFDGEPEDKKKEKQTKKQQNHKQNLKKTNQQKTVRQDILSWFHSNAWVLSELEW